MTQALRRRLAILRGAYFAILFSGAAYSTFANLYFASVGLSGYQIGLLAALGPAVALFAQPLWGELADRRWGPAATLGAASLAGAAATLLVPAAGSFAAVVPAIAALSLFTSAQTPMAGTLAMKLSEESNGRIPYGHVRLVGYLGFASANYILGLILERTGLVHLFYWHAASLAAVALTAWLMRGQRARAAPLKVKADRSEIGALLRQAPLRATVAAYFFSSVSISLGQIYLGLHLRGMGGGESVVGLAYAAGSVSALPVYAVEERLRRVFGLYPAFLIAAALLLIRWVATLSIGNPVWVIAVQLMHGLPLVLSYTATLDFVYNRASERGKATAMSLVAASTALSGAVAASLGGALYQLGAGRAVLTAAAAASVAVLFILVLARRRIGGEVGRLFRGMPTSRSTSRPMS